MTERTERTRQILVGCVSWRREMKLAPEVGLLRTGPIDLDALPESELSLIEAWAESKATFESAPPALRAYVDLLFARAG